MALGVELNSIAPNLIRDSGQALVHGIRQIGQQISGHLTEIQTKRDMAAMAQELQGLNVQSNEFTPQLAQVISRHPMAARDERGQLALSILGKAHGQWQAGEAEARAFNRAMAMQTARDRSAREMFDYKTKVESETPQNIGGSLVIPKDPVTGQPNVLLPAPSRAGSNRPLVLNQGDIAIDPTGKRLAENPKPSGPTSSEARMQKKDKISQLLRQDTQLQREIGDAIKRLDDIQKQDLELGKDEAKIGHPKKDFLVTTAKAIQDEVKALRDRRLEIQKMIESVESTAAADGDGDLGLPPVTPNAAAPMTPAAAVKRVPVLDPNGQPMQLRADQVEAALQNGWKLR